MNIPYKETKIYSWHDGLLPAIIKEMGIKEEHFRNYGGEYKDCWHVALDTFIPDRMRNDTVVHMYPMDYEGEEEYYLKGRPWAAPLFEAYQKVMRELDPNEQGIYVEFSW